MEQPAVRQNNAGATMLLINGRRQMLPQADTTTIIGIDYSGAQSDRNTWVAIGELTADGGLELISTEMTPRRKVTELLLDVPTPAVAGIDFPFGVPGSFAEFLNGDCDMESMPEVWRIVSRMGQDEFIAFRDAFVERLGEPKRSGDARYFPESFSPLHKANPNMLPMTYHGMRMLNELHELRSDRWIVPPVNSTEGTSCETVTLLESMPGAFLNAIGFGYSVFKRYKKARNALHNRRKILACLPVKSGIALPNLADFREKCLANDDCLDSVIAGVAAASWARNPDKFRHPTGNEIAFAKLEGWIYVPQSEE